MLTSILLLLMIIAGVVLSKQEASGQKPIKKTAPIPKEYFEIAHMLFLTMAELAPLLSVKQALSAERMKPAMLEEVWRKDSNGDYIFIYELLRTGHIPENERIAADKIQRVIKQINETNGIIIVESFKYLESVAQMRIRFVASKK